MQDVPLDIPVSSADFAEGASYPPVRAGARTRKLTALRGLYRGDMSHFVEDEQAASVATNWFFRLAEVLSALMVSTQPPEDLQDQIQACVIEMLTVGRGYFVMYDDILFVPAAENCWRDYDDPDVLHVVSRYVSLESDAGQYDRAYVYSIGETTATLSDVVLRDAKFGQVLNSSTDSGSWSYADRPPVLDTWGTSAFEQLIPLVVELALRRTGVSRVLAKHESPTLVMPGNEVEIGKALTVSGQPGTLPQLGKPFIQQAAEDLLDSDSAWIPDNTTDPEYLTWDGQLVASFMQIDGLEQDLSMMTGLVQLLQLDSNPSSGTSLREQHRVLSWTAGQLWSRCLAALTDIVGTFEWPNPLDELFDAALQSTDVDVDDEDPEVDDEG